MLNEIELINIFKKDNINCFEFDKEKSKEIFSNGFKLMKLDEFIKFIISNSIKNVFFNFSYYNKNDYLINNNKIKEIYKEVYTEIHKNIEYIEPSLFLNNPDEIDINEDLLNKIKNRVESYNERFEKIDFSKAYKSIIFCKFKDDYFYIEDNDLWGDDLQIEDYSKFIYDLKFTLKKDIEKKLIF